jgi:hypothetical protein
MKQPTRQEIDAARSKRGGWTRAQLAEWGVPWPPPRRWKRRLLRESTAARAETGPAVIEEFGAMDGMRSERLRISS